MNISLVLFQKGREYLTKVTIYSFDEISVAKFGFGKFSCSCEVLLSFSFISVCSMASALNILWYLKFCVSLFHGIYRD